MFAVPSSAGNGAMVTGAGGITSGGAIAAGVGAVAVAGPVAVIATSDDSNSNSNKRPFTPN